MLTYQEQKEQARIQREAPLARRRRESKLLIALFVIVAALLLLMSSFVRAADLPAKASPWAPASAYTWNGFWLGIRGGRGVNATSAASLTDGITTIDFGAAPKGIVGGLNGGLDLQLGQSVVAGLYIEQDFADLRASTNVGSISLANLTNYLGAAGARFGYLVTPASLIYVKGGFAWVGAHPDFAAVGTSKAISDTSTGYEVGVGLEHRMNANWSVKIEYDHTKAGDKTMAISEAMTSTAHYTIDKGMVGISYRF